MIPSVYGDIMCCFRMANAHVRRVSVVTSASFAVRKGIMGKTVRRNVIATTTSHVTQKMGAATSDVPRAEWVTAVIKVRTKFLYLLC